MCKVFIYITIFLFLFIFVVYSGFWYFSACKIKNLLAETILYINDEKFDILHDFRGFPFDLIFYVINPKFSSEQLTVSSEALVIKNRVFNKLVYIYIPRNKIDVTIHRDEKRSIKCHTNDNNHLVVKLKDLPFLLRFNRNGSMIDYIDIFRYEDSGLRCNVAFNSKNQQSFVTEIDGKNNYIQFHLNKKFNENVKLGFDFYAYRIISSENCLNVNTKFSYEFINQISVSRINFSIEKFLIRSNNFTFTADGGISNYDLVTSSFKDKINFDILNYKELVSFIIDKKSCLKASDMLEKLIFSLSEKTVDDRIQFSIKYNYDLGLSFIGKLSITDFMSQLSQITALIRNENGS